MAKIIFLDIDGGLNAGCPDEPFVLPHCAQHFNRIVAATGARVVISSAWRAAVHAGEMTLLGFQRLLRTHRVQCRVVGVTPEARRASSRGKQITLWLKENGPVGSYVVLDDDDLGIREEGQPFVRTDGGKGLTEQDAIRAIELLNPSPPSCCDNDIYARQAPPAFLIEGVERLRVP